MTVSGIASLATFKLNENEVPKSNTEVTSNGLPLSTSPEVPALPQTQELESKEEMTREELIKMDKDVRNRRDAQLLLSGAVNSTTTFFKDVADEQFAVDVNVNIDLTRESTPESTIRKMRNILVANNSLASPTKKDIAVTLMAMTIMNEARMVMNKEVKNEAFGIPRTHGAMGNPFSMNMGTNNFADNSRMDSMTTSFRTNNQLTGLLINMTA